MRSSYLLYIFCVPLLLCSSVQIVSAEETYTPVGQWVWGTVDEHLNDQLFIAVDNSSNIYVTCSGVNYDWIKKFTSTGTLITKWGSHGSGDGQFSYPRGVAVDSAGNVYVADTGNDRIQKFTSTGTFITKWGSCGSGDGQFSFPKSVAVDSAGNVYVADEGNRRIEKFTSTGGYLTQWGSSGEGNGQFSCLGGIAVDSTGNVYVTDMGNGRIQKFTSTGAFIKEWGTWGMNDGYKALNSPAGIAVDSADNVYVTDTKYGIPLILKFTSTGTFITEWYYTAWSKTGNTNDTTDIYGIAVDSAGIVYVTDDRVLKFAPAGTTPTTTPTPTVTPTVSPVT
jgi:sugar lactone lactonase YvrE